MTRIIKLEMKGFKSFAKQTDILFQDDFNVVIGPNGSGKSNVIDALCFVLGKSSAKGLRAEKSANLIYNGGKSKQPMKEGEVSIYFDNSSKIFPLDAPEIKVTRVIKDSGQSVYKINGKKHTRNEVLDFLYFAKINPDGYNIILQGDIIRFVEMSGEDRRRIIEQISDISVYEDKKQKAILELDKVEQSFKEAQIILNERNSYLRDLSKEREQALAFKDLDIAVKRGRATLLSKTMGDKQSQVDKINEGNASTIKAQQELQTLINELRKEIAEKKALIAQINAQIESQGDKEQVALHKKLELLKVEVATATNRVQVITDEIARIHTRKTQLQASRAELVTKTKQLGEQKKAQDISLSTNQKMQLQIRANITEFRKKHNMEQAGEVDKQIEDIDKKIEEQQKEVDKLREQQQDMLRTKDRLELQIKNADEKIIKVLEVSKAHKTEIDNLKQKRVEFKKVTVELSQKLNADASMIAQVSNARSKINFLNEELAKLNARRASIQETLGGSMAIAKIIENKHKLGGVHGTISSLGSVEAKYAKALEIAAGNKIKAIVVDDDVVAERCIQFLKQNQLGVATFLPLNKIKGHAISETLPKSGTHGFAIDLITFDKKYKNAFSHVFTNTVIVEDIAAARKVGIGSLRMVTIDGDLTETSGAMQGGFRKGTTTGLGFTQKEVTDKTDSYQRELGDAQTVLSKLEEQKFKNDEDISRLREFKAALEGDIIKVEKSLHLDDGDLEISKKLKDEFTKELDTVNSEYMKLQMTISGVNRTLAQFKIDRQMLRNKITDMRNPTKLAELTTFEDKLRVLQEEASKLEGEQKHIASEISNIIEPEIENTGKIISQHEKEEAGFKTEIETQKQKIATLQAELVILEEKEAVFYKQFKAAFAQRSKLSEEVEKLESKTIKKEEEIREKERRTTIVSIEVAKLQAELSVLSDEFKAFGGVEIYTDKDIDEVKKIVSSAERELIKIGAVNMKAIDMFDKVQAEYDKLIEKRKTLGEEKENVLVMINEIEVRKKDLFLAVFNRLNENFQRIYSSLSPKSEAYIELENPDQPFEGGVNVKVKLAGKKFMDIRSLSGGEKTMTALAFIFAIQENDPASFYIMDEVDAALDKRNAEKLAELVTQYSKRAQYIVISHNDGVIAGAKTIYGVSMDVDTGTSKVVSLKL